MSEQADQKESAGQGFTFSNNPFIPKEDAYVSFTLRLDKAVYFNTPEPDPPAHLIAQLVFRGTVIPPVIVEFFSLQRFELLIINSSDTEVYRWSKGRAFPFLASIGPVVGEVSWKVDVILADSNGKSLPAGRYVTKAFLATSVDGTVPQDIPGKYSASVGFLISNQIPPLAPFG
jgi:hypothetical protein